MFAGLLMSRVVKPLKLPAVTGYLIAGLLIGPFVLGRLGVDGLGFTSFNAVEAMKPISEVALGFIAFNIGNEFRLSQLRIIGKQATVVAIVQALSATVLVDACLLGLHFLMPDKITVPVAITLGAIATATAPAATLMVVNQYKAKGPLVDILLPVVALDDAVGLIDGILHRLVGEGVEPQGRETRGEVALIERTHDHLLAVDGRQDTHADVDFLVQRANLEAAILRHAPLGDV